MSLFHHPAFPKIVQEFPDEKTDEVMAAGWVPMEDTADPAVSEVSQTSTACGEEVATTHRAWASSEGKQHD